MFFSDENEKTLQKKESELPFFGGDCFKMLSQKNREQKMFL